MQKAYSRIKWENKPSQETPLNDANLNRMDSAIDEVDNRILTLDITKANKTEISNLFSEISFDESTGVLTFTRKNGSTIRIDTKLEKLAVNFSYDADNERLVITLDDGSVQYVDMKALITQYEFTESDTIILSVDSSGKVMATIKKGSITGDMLEPNYLANVTVQAESAAASAASASASAESAKSDADRAEEAASRAESIVGFTIDTELDAESTNPIANKAVAEAFENVENVIGVTPQMFGAKGDGVTDDTQAFLYLATYANGRDYTHISIPEGHYIINGQIIFNRNVDIIGSGKGTVLDFSSAEISDVGITVTGSCALVDGLSGDATKGDNYISLIDNGTIAQGDIIAICDQNDYSWYSSKAYYRKGELIKVSEINESGLLTCTPLYDSYTADSVLVYKINSVTGSIKDLSVIGKHSSDDVPDENVINVVFGENFFVNNVEGHNSNRAILSFSRCYNCNANNLSFDTSGFPAIGYNYGLIVANSMYIRVANSYLRSVRHGITTGGGADDVNIVNRGCIYTNNICISTENQYAIDAHTNSESINVCDNFTNGIWCEGSDINITNNIVVANSRGIHIGVIDSANISNNKVRSFLPSTDNNGAISVDILAVRNGIPVVKINDNMVISDALNIRVQDTSRRCDFVIQNNVVSRNSSYAILCYRSVGAIISGNRITGGMLCRDSEYAKINDNVLTTTINSFGLYSYDCDRVNATNNDITGECSIASIRIDSTDTLILKDNKVYGCGENSSGSDRTCFKSVNVGELIVVGNHFDVGATENSYRCLAIQNNSNLTFYDNLITGKNTIIENPNTLYFGQTIGNNGAKVVYCNAIPTTGKYGLGSICYNTAPSSGNPVGWVCTGAGEGTAATWVPFATI